MHCLYNCRIQGLDPDFQEHIARLKAVPRDLITEPVEEEY